MNYLAHAYLSYNQPQILAGNMMGDYIKGKNALLPLPVGIRNGIMLHRAIDDFTDHHEAVQRSKVLFRETYHLYAGAIIDTVFDHFLANDPRYFTSEQALYDFSQTTYELLESESEWFTEKFAQMFPYMRTQNWLYHYRTLKGVQQSLNGLARRAKNMPPPDEAYEIFISNFFILNQAYFELIDDLTAFVKSKNLSDFTFE